VFDSVDEAVAKRKANASIVFVPAPNTKDAIIEAIEGGLRLVVVITERIPFHDSLEFIPYARTKGVTIIGPNCPGIITPAESKAGIMPSHIFQPGDCGVISRSGTLTYEIVNAMTQAGVGQSTCIGIGGDPIIGTNTLEALELFQRDRKTKRIVVVGEIGGTAEEEAAEYIRRHVTKPVVAYVAGRTAPPGKRMGHAGAIIEGNRGTADSKVKAFNEAGVPVADYPADVASLLASA
jgi:succinyl-CoA synthetase alpha subunit